MQGKIPRLLMHFTLSSGTVTARNVLPLDGDDDHEQRMQWGEVERFLMNPSCTAIEMPGIPAMSVRQHRVSKGTLQSLPKSLEVQDRLV